MKKLIKKEWYITPILFNARETLIKQNEIRSLNELSKEIGVSINTLQKIKKEELIAIESARKLIDWSDTIKGRTPFSKLNNLS